MDNEKRAGSYRSIGRIVGLVVTIAMLIAVVLALFWIFFLPERRFLFGTLGAVTQRISDVTGLDETLVKGIVTVLTLPLFAVLGTSYWEILKKKLNPLLLYRDWKGWVVVGYVAAYWILVGTLQQRAPRWCVVTPEGLKGFDIQRPDPVYGLPSHRCSPLEIAIIRGQRRVVEVSVTDPAHTQFFDTSTEPPQPLIWYSIGLNDQFHFYNGPGADRENQILQPITRKIVGEIVQRYREEERRISAEQREQGASHGTETESSNSPSAGSTSSTAGSPPPETNAVQSSNVSADLKERQWIGYFLKASEGPPVDGMKTFFDSTVSPYFGQSTVGWAAIAEDKEHYFARFPSIEYTLVGEPRVLRQSEDSRTIEFDVRYVNTRRDGARMRGLSHMMANLSLVNGQWRISGIWEKTAAKSNASDISEAASRQGVLSGSAVAVPPDVMSSRKISGDNPEYPAIARAARIQGTVTLQATISPTGEVEKSTVVSGPPMLQMNAQNAVRTWRYQPYMVNGVAVEVTTQINVTFKLGV